MRHGFIKTAAATPSIRVADCLYNTEKIISLIKKASEESVHLLVLPQLCVTGHTCQDLFFQQALTEGAMECSLKIAQSVPRNMVVVFGCPVEHLGKLYNCAVVASNSKILGIVPATYTASRWFAPAPDKTVDIEYADSTVPFGSRIIFSCRTLPSFRLACAVSDDITAPLDPMTGHALSGASIIACSDATPDYAASTSYRTSLIESTSSRLICSCV